MLSAGILTHKSPVTLQNTLASYKAGGLFDYIQDFFCVIQPSETAKDEEAVCNSFGVRPILEEQNGMMAWGIKRVFEEAKNEYVLFLECDFRCVTKSDTTKQILDYALNVLSNKSADIVRVRSLKYPGHSNYFEAVAKGKELSNESHIRQLYQCTHYYDEPHKVFPQYISQVQNNPSVFKMSSKNCVYTNNPTITSKVFFSKYILPYIQFGKHLEPEIDPIWTKNDHTIFITPGIFTHCRVDGHEGRDCGCCPKFHGERIVYPICHYKCCKNGHYNPTPFSEEDLLY